jgi:hypothetical protein
VPADVPRATRARLRGAGWLSAAALSRVAAWTGVAAALLLLNLSLTFRNVWPTLAIRPTAELSPDLAVGLLALLLVHRWTGHVSARFLRGAAVVWVLLIAGRYVDVTTRALYGRDVNPYWDLRHVPSVGAMFATVADPWQTALFAAGAIAAPLAVYAAARWCIGTVGRAAAEPAGRRVLGALTGVSVVLLAAAQVGWRPVERLQFADPVASAYAREAYELAYEMSGAGLAALGPPPVLRSDLSRVAGADVLLVFMESYGVVSWERPAFVDALAASRAALAADIRETGRDVVSARVESTTFAGESWLAHISLLSGTEVRDDRANARLMAQERDTLVTVFQRGGYRALAIVPGLLVAWPEGAFYGYDEVYDYQRLDYRGPPFGWWSINDQYSLARVDRLEIEPRDREPRFVFFSTLSTHAPFTPAPPYQPDWRRVLAEQPYDDDELYAAWSEQPDWTNLDPSYVQAFRYAYATAGGYLRLRADRDLVLILVGDHQPPALVSGEGASWDVPVHVIASRPALLDRLRLNGFREGLAPGGESIARMHALLPLLLDAFGDVSHPAGAGAATTPAP